jgi:hypothetical protein
MFFATDIRPGDAVLCTVGAPLQSSHVQAPGHLKQGRVYRVRELVQMNGEVGLCLSGVDDHPIAGFRASGFRKIRAAEPDFVRSCLARFRRPKPRC